MKFEEQRLEVGVWGTVFYLIAVLGFAVVYGTNNPSFLPKTLESLGTAVAGIFSPLAFFWLVLGYMQQGEELRAQAEELKNSVKAQSDLVEVSRRQLEAQIEAFQTELIQYKEQKEPRVICSIQYYESRTGGGCIVGIDLCNVGGVLCNVIIKATSDKIEHPIRVSIFDREAPQSLKLPCRWHNVYSIKVSGVDYRSERRRFSFKLYVVDQFPRVALDMESRDDA